MDLQMLVVAPGGREGSEADYRQLLHEAGFSLMRVIPTTGPLSTRINVGQAAREVIRMLYDAVGGSAIYSKKNPFDLALRDAETWCQHLAVQRRTLEWVGGLLLKSDGPPPFPLL